MRIDIPRDVEFIINQLNEKGYEGYAVGGCVRDVMLGREPNDWDITTSAKPEQVKDIFKRTVDTGLKHGTVTILLNGEQYEVTTYRIDGEYEDNRRPKDVEFTKNLHLDLERRDFTINAMAYNHEEGIVDPFNGLEDLENKVIKCVGNPNHRFQEDGLRMLRAIRFSAQTGFKIDINTRKAIKFNAHLIKNISAERIQVELNKTLVSNHPDYIKQLVKFKLMDRIMPEFLSVIKLDQCNPNHIYTVDEHIYESLKNIEANHILRWTMMLHDIGKGKTKTVDEEGIGHFYGHPKVSVDMARDILNRLKFDNDSKNKILKLIEFHDYRFEAVEKQVRRAVNKISPELFMMYLKVRKADISAQNPRYYEARSASLNSIEEIYNKIMLEKQCLSIKELAISGKDLLDEGVPHGKIIGDILGQLLEEVLENPANNNREWLLECAKKWYK